MPRAALLSLTTLLLFFSFSTFETEPIKRKKPVRTAVAKTDPMLSMNKKKNKKLNNIKKTTTKK